MNAGDVTIKSLKSEHRRYCENAVADTTRKLIYSGIVGTMRARIFTFCFHEAF